MNVLITGAAGALGRNLTENLKAIRDGKNRTRPTLQIDEIYEYDINNTEADLDRFCSNCDYVVHAAGVNRPKDTSEFMEGNFGFTNTLLNKLKEKGNKAPILITSSVQATLTGRFGDSEYGRSKLAGEELLFRYGEETGTKHKSKPLSKLCDVPEEEMPVWFRNGLRAALMAPTAMNQQKFRISLEEGEPVITAGRGAMTKIDLGIVKYNFEAASGHKCR